MKDIQLKILKTMSEATTRMDFTMFSQAVNLTPNDTIAQMEQLTQTGFLHKVGTGYAITEKGKNAPKISVQVPKEKAFVFFVEMDKSLGFSAHSLEEFYRLVRQLYSGALDFHLYRGDFENWIREIIGDNELADEVEGLKELGLKGEELRKTLLKSIDERYGVGELL